jgi:pimeloyl-ACP methyl ester carboxylesterase
LSIRNLTARDLAAGHAERVALDETFEQLRQLARSHGDLPLVVLAAERSIACFEPRDYPQGGADAVRPAWRALLDDLARRSSRGRVEVVPACGHMVPFERPGAIVDAVRSVM